MIIYGCEYGGYYNRVKGVLTCIPHICCLSIKAIFTAENWYSKSDVMTTESYKSRSEKTGLQGFRPGLTQTGLYSHKRWLES